MKNIIAKLSIHGLPVVFDVASYDEGRIKAFVNGEQKIVSIDYYNMAKPLPEEDVHNTILAYCRAMNTPIEEINVRARLPKGYALHKEQLASATPIVAAQLKPPVEDISKATAASASRQERKNKRAEAAKRRYEAELAATNTNAANAVAHAAKAPVEAVAKAEPLKGVSAKELSNMIAVAVANAVAEALKAPEKQAA